MDRTPEEKIDFVIAWVDGADPAWRREFAEWKERCSPPDDREKNRASADTSAERYRDWDLMRYWFRGIEKFAPWVNRIHFMTWGHVPAWLDTSSPKLNIVKHTDFIPGEYLPTFSSCPIELNMYRIEGLAERFVYFNDDMFLLRPVPAGRFFRKGLPCDMARLSVIRGERIDHNMLECVALINKRHRKHGTIRRDFGKWFNYRYRAVDIFKTMSLLPWSFFPGFKEHHMPQPFLRSTFETLWDEEPGALDATSRHRFRELNDLLQWAAHYEQLVTGRFAPHGCRDAALRTLSEGSTDAIAGDIRSGRYAMMCINDSDSIADFEGVKSKLTAAFEAILPEKSSYEK